MAMADETPVILSIPIEIPRDIHIVHRYFRLFAFFLAPLIICDTKGICQIRERGRPSVMDQPLAERLCQNIYISYLELLSSMNYEHSRILILEWARFIVLFLMTQKSTWPRSLSILSTDLLIFKVTPVELIVMIMYFISLRGRSCLISSGRCSFFSSLSEGITLVFGIKDSL